MTGPWFAEIWQHAGIVAKTDGTFPDVCGFVASYGFVPPKVAPKSWCHVTDPDDGFRSALIVKQRTSRGRKQ